MGGCFDYGIGRSLVYQKFQTGSRPSGNGEYWRGQGADFPMWLKPYGLVATGISTASGTLLYAGTGPVGTPGPLGSAAVAGTGGCFDYGIPRSLLYQKNRGNGEYWRGKGADFPMWLKPYGLVATGISTASGTLVYAGTGPVGTPGSHYPSFIAYGRGLSISGVVSPPSWDFFRGRMAVVGPKHFTITLVLGTAAGTSGIAGGAIRVALPTGTLAGTSALAGASILRRFDTGAAAGTSGLTGAAIRRVLPTGTLAGTSTLAGASIRKVLPTGTLAGTSTVAGTARFLTFATATSAGTGATTGVATRRVFPTGTLAGASGITGAGIRQGVATGELDSASAITGQGKRIVWTTGTLTGATSLVEGVPTTRIFAPAWGNSALTGDTQVAYVGQASAWSPAVVTGLGGYVLVESAEALAGTSAAFSIHGANLKAGAIVCGGASDLAGDGNAILGGGSEADGSVAVLADTCVAFVAGGVLLAGDGFDLDGNPQPSTTSAFAGATTHAAASAPGGSRVEGSAPTPVPATGTITGSSDVLYLEVVIYDAEELDGLSTTDATANLDMRAHALSVNLSYPVATANYDPVQMAGAFLGGSIARGLATVEWNERPPR